MHPPFCLRRLENDAHPGMQGVGNAAQHAQGMALVAGGFQAADLLLGCFEQLGELLLGKAGLLAQRGYLQRDIPSLACVIKTGSKCRILQLFFEITVKIGFFHGSVLFRQ